MHACTGSSQNHFPNFGVGPHHPQGKYIENFVVESMIRKWVTTRSMQHQGLAKALAGKEFLEGGLRKLASLIWKKLPLTTRAGNCGGLLISPKT